MRPSLLAVAALAACLVVVACDRGAGPATTAGNKIAAAVSPLVGKWTGKSDMKDKGLGSFANAVAGGPLTGPSSLRLEADGTGYLKVADQPERPITWKQDGSKLTLSVQGAGGGSADEGDGSRALGSGPYVATLSSDGRTMTIDMEKVKVTLNKQSGADTAWRPTPRA